MRLRTQDDFKRDIKNHLENEAKGIIKMIISVLSERAMKALIELIYRLFKDSRDVQIIDED